MPTSRVNFFRAVINIQALTPGFYPIVLLNRVSLPSPPTDFTRLSYPNIRIFNISFGDNFFSIANSRNVRIFYYNHFFYSSLIKLGMLEEIILSIQWLYTHSHTVWQTRESHNSRSHSQLTTELYNHLILKNHYTVWMLIMEKIYHYPTTSTMAFIMTTNLNQYRENQRFTMNLNPKKSN